MSERVIRIVIADDSPAIRDGLSKLLNPVEGLDVVAMVGDGLEAVATSQELRPDVVIMDAQMPNMDGVEATRRVKLVSPGSAILFFSVFADSMEASLAAGADRFLTKDCDSDELILAVMEIAAGERGKGRSATTLNRTPWGD